MSSDKNIFLIIKDSKHPKFRSNKELLDMIYFNNDSIVIHSQQKQKYRVKCLEEISPFARLLVKGLKHKNMPEKMVIGERPQSQHGQTPTRRDDAHFIRKTEKLRPPQIFSRGRGRYQQKETE